MNPSPQTAAEFIDQSGDLQRPPVRRRWLLVIALALLVPIILIAVAGLSVIVWLRVRHTTATQHVHEEVARIRASGEPVSTEDLFEFHQVPAGERDITALWQEAFDSLDADQFQEDIDDLPVNDNDDFAFNTPDQLGQGERFLAKYDGAIQATLTAAKARGECRFPVAFDDEMQAKLPHAVKLRQLATLLTVRLRVCKARGDIAGALDSLHAMFAAVRTHEDAPMMIEQMVRFGVSDNALHETVGVLCEFDLAEEQLVRLKRDVRGLQIEKSLTLALIGERSLGYHSFHHLGQLTDSDQLDAHDGQLTLPVDCQFFLEQMKRFIDASRKPYPEALRDADQVDARFRQVMDDPLEKFAYMVTLLMAPAYRAAFDKAGELMARRELVSCALAVERFRRMHRRSPQDLNDLASMILPSIPIDPFSGKQVQLKVSGDELVFYSIARDATDDGGRENNRHSKPDIVVRIRQR